jgi:glyoxylase-like metal-dependent hydrolase (beta-lactamase superfamily II)
VIHTPGHAPDHVCFWNEQTGDLFGGDMMVKDSTVMIPGGRGGSLRDYLDSLQRIATLRPARILPGHGPVIETPLELIQEYIEHRRMRETQILEALNDGVSAIDAIVDRVYPDLQYGVRPAARLTVEAHLTKLREEGRLPN